MATNQETINTILQTVIADNYPNSTLSDYYNVSTGLAVTPNVTSPDRLMQLITETLTGIRNPAAYGNGVDLTLGQRQELYQDAIDALDAPADLLAAIVTALTTAKAALT